MESSGAPRSQYSHHADRFSSALFASLWVDACTGAADIEGMLSEVRRILKPGGLFLFTARQPGLASRHYEVVGLDWTRGLEQSGFKVASRTLRPEVSRLWQSLYGQWLKHEEGLRCELRPETVDGLVAEATRGMQKMSDGRPWYLIRATVTA